MNIANNLHAIRDLLRSGSSDLVGHGF